MDGSRDEPLLMAHGVCVGWPAGLQRDRPRHQAVDGVQLALHAAESLGLLGESDSGASLLARALAGLVPLSGGALYWRGVPLRAGETGRCWPGLALPYLSGAAHAALDPCCDGAAVLGEALHCCAPSLPPRLVQTRMQAVLDRVGLPRRTLAAYPHALSGEACVRLALARALIVAPQGLLCDELLAGLDLLQQERLARLIDGIRREYALSMLWVSQDAARARTMVDRVAVMCRGRIVETGPAAVLYEAAAHPYTRALLSDRWLPSCWPGRSG